MITLVWVDAPVRLFRLRCQVSMQPYNMLVHCDVHFELC